MRRAGLLLLFFFSMAASVQPAPFDMSPEREVIPAPKDTPASFSSPLALPPAKASSGAVSPQAAPPVAIQPKAERKAETYRPILPAPSLTLAGETAKRAWSVHLTPEQAQAPASLTISYQNAIVVAPETSQLRVFVNDSLVIEEPIRSSDSVSPLKVDLPPRLLQSGANLFRVEARQRHRTDCTIQSTYELWTTIEAAATGLLFQDAYVARLRRLDDIRAIGVNEAGETHFRLIAPSLEEPSAVAALIGLSENLALLANMPHQTVSIATAPEMKSGPGEMTALVGPAAELGAILPDIPASAAAHAVIAFRDAQNSLGAPFLLVTGPNWEAIATAVEEMAASLDRPPTVARTRISHLSWRAPDTPLVLAKTTLSLAELGIVTEEFSGRRFRRDFTIGMPADFYANSYGEAKLMLDAAYSSDVRPGSHIDVYVNNNIAATVPITTAGGAILRHLPINVPMRYFRPGVNEMAIEATLSTKADAACLPGATAESESRFVLFDTSEIVIPDFARIARRPDLSSLAGAGYPYGQAETPIPLIMKGGAETLSAAATLLARLSVAAERPLRVDPTASPSGTHNQSALFVGAITQIPQGILPAVGVPEATRLSWGDLEGAGTETDADPLNTEITFERWREKLSTSHWRGQISALQDWLERTFDLSFGALRIAPAVDTEFTPPRTATLLLAQGANPAGTGTWTVIAAPTEAMLRDGMAAIAADKVWSRLDGPIATYAALTGELVTLPLQSFGFVETQPGSFWNYRLIAANWLSDNVLSYSSLLIIFSILLGLVTSGLLNALGRNE